MDEVKINVRHSRYSSPETIRWMLLTKKGGGVKGGGGL